MEQEIEILLNGEKTVITGGLTVEGLISNLGLKRDQVAVEVNRSILKREVWGDHVLAHADVVEIVHFVGGGKE